MKSRFFGNIYAHFAATVRYRLISRNSTFSKYACTGLQTGQFCTASSFESLRDLVSDGTMRIKIEKDKMECLLLSGSVV